MLSIYENLYNTTAVVEEQGELFEILDELFNGFRFDKKSDGFLICPSTFNGTRGLDNHISSTSIGLDIDSGMTVDEAIDKLRMMGFGAFIYTTPSSRNFDKFRIFIKFDKPVTSVEDFRDIWLVLNTAFNGSVDIATQHAACVFFTPAKYRGANNYAVTIEGTDIDVGLFIRVGRLLRTASRPKPNTIPISAKQGIVQKPQRVTGLKPYNPTFLNLQDCKFVKQKYLDEYFGLASGNHHLGLYVFMTRVAGVAKARKYQISDHQLAEIARQLDLAYRGCHKQRDIQNEAARAISFVYGGNA